MAERAHPADPGFKSGWQLVRYKRVIPWVVKRRNPYRDALHWRYAMVARHCGGKDVLDVPCGMGWGTSFLKRSRSLVGVDISPDAIAEARAKYGAVAEFKVGDMKQLDFAAASFDIVSCLEGIEHVPPAVGQAFIAECHRVLREDGQLFMSSPHCTTAEHSGNPYHFKEYKPEELRQMLEPYFEIISVVPREVDNLIVSMFHARRRKGL